MSLSNVLESWTMLSTLTTDSVNNGIDPNCTVALRALTIISYMGHATKQTQFQIDNDSWIVMNWYFKNDFGRYSNL